MCQGVTWRCFLRSAVCLLAFMRAAWLYKCVCVCVCVCVWLCSCWAPQVHRPSITRCGHYTQAGVEVDNAPTAATAGASTARGSSVWLASGNQADSGLPVCVTDNVTNTHLYTRARKYNRQPAHTHTHTHTWSAGLLLWCKKRGRRKRGRPLTSRVSRWIPAPQKQISKESKTCCIFKSKTETNDELHFPPDRPSSIGRRAICFFELVILVNTQLGSVTFHKHGAALQKFSSSRIEKKQKKHCRCSLWINMFSSAVLWLLCGF